MRIDSKRILAIIIMLAMTLVSIPMSDEKSIKAASQELKNSYDVEAFTFDGHKYEILSRKDGMGVTWTEAEKQCKLLGGHLVSITSKAEQEAIQNAVIEKLGQYAKNNYWIGAHRVENTEKWKWVTGEVWEYENWGVGEPNKYNGELENCAHIVGQETQDKIIGDWNDTPDDGAGDYAGPFFDLNEYGFICEYDSHIDYKPQYEFAGFSADIEKNIPFVGEGKLQLDFGAISMYVKEKEDELKIGIGCDDLTDKDFNNLKKYVDRNDHKTWEDLKDKMKDKGFADLGWKNKVEVGLCGYIEAKKDGNKLKTITGNVVFTAKGSFSKEQQYVVWVIPVVLKLKGEVGVDAKYSLDLDYENQKIYFDGELTLSLPKITISAGIGAVGISDVSIYGSADNQVKLEMNNHVTGTLEGEIGISAKALMWSYKTPIFKGTLEWGHSTSKETKSLLTAKSIDEDAYEIDRVDGVSVSKNDKMIKMNALTGEQDASAANSIIHLTENGYNDMKPKMVSLKNGSKMLVYTASRAERTTGNNTAICYRIYDETKGKWSKEKLVDNDQSNPTADFYSDVVSCEGDTYVVWTDTCRSDFSESTELEEMASACEIKVAKYNSDTDTFSEPEILTNNKVPDLKARIVLTDGVPHIVWLQNVNKDVLQMSGENKIMSAKLDNGKWTVSELASINKPIRSFEAGIIENKPVIVYSQDEDMDSSTIKDCELYQLELEGDLKKITNNDVYEENPSIMNLPDCDVITWFVDGEGIYKKNDSENAICMVENDGILSSDYKWIPMGQNGVIVCSGKEEEQSNIYGYLYGDNSFSKCVQLTNTDGYVSDMSGYGTEDGYGIAFINTKAEIEDDDVTESSDLCFLALRPYTNLCIDNVEYAEDEVVPGGQLETNIIITNKGMLPSSNTKVVVKHEGKLLQEYEITDTIKAGESKDVNLAISLPENMSSNSAFDFYIVAGNDVSENDNTYQKKIGKPDLELDIDELSNKSGVEYTVKNISPFSSTAVLQLCDADNQNKVLKEFDLGELAPNETKIDRIPTTLLKQLAENEDSLFFQVITASEEQFSYNNSCMVYIDELDETVTFEPYITSPPTRNPVGDSETDNPTHTTKPIGSSKPVSTTKPAVTSKPTNTTKPAATSKPTGTTKPAATSKPTNTKQPSHTNILASLANSPMPVYVLTEKDGNSELSSIAKKATLPRLTYLKVKSKRKSFIVSWKKQKGVVGYQVQYAANRQFRKKKSMLVKKNRATIKKLKSKRIYYVRVRSYIVNGKNKVYGIWSKRKKAKIK